jgi:holo-[acyl-carrier protein] synthase
VIVRVGTDLADVVLMRDQLEESGGDFATTFLVAAELAVVVGDPERIAGRWAAKEAVMKALGLGFGRIDPLHIQILPDERGRPIVTLGGSAARRAAELGLTLWDVSISHESTVASAVAVGYGG